MKLILYVPQILISAAAIFILVRCFISLFSMRPAGRPKAVLINKFNGKKLAISTYETSLGRGRSCDIQLASQLASRSHAVISRRKQGWFITDTDSKVGTFVNGEKITEPTRIYHDDTLSIGGVDYTFVAPHAKKDGEKNYSDDVNTESAAADGFIVNCATNYEYPITGGQLSIGRNPANDIVIDDMTVSRNHALIQHTQDGWYIVDTDSAAGVGLNGYKVHGREELSDGDQIMINAHNFIFREKRKRGALHGKRR
jgi:pSer/pThr/pTyr-binding forkhead associated (FHA) protein